MFDVNDREYIKLRRHAHNFFVANTHLNGILYGNLFRIFAKLKRKHYELMKRTRIGLNIFFLNIISERIRKSDNFEECCDLLDHYLKAIKAEEEYFDLENLIVNFTLMFTAGTDTSSLTLK
ncbi:hypothetical protein B4U79_18770 [Dinothrombium tinctorium]|uniref:Uncharacterized protein n=1 Tax=Dinothrombium tinctorium TaxID=1965070 RepID=A0A3S3RG97_9ACAR|nr:hypothetical protein B4U79_18787 [Dinothrombium tinctorium]RWR99406.1 hypothetical protein B4U79_18784 [Dinothrombium tinctorium]RWR99555.1 hypothetical protein B4U79_18770 [Dinothrombium tinctorium]